MRKSLGGRPNIITSSEILALSFTTPDNAEVPVAGQDLFGLERERKIQASGVRAVFTPHQPINSVELFFGRQDKVQKLIEHINTPGQHALLYGDRGVGKSSLANVAAKLLLGQLIQGELYEKRCDSSTGFEQIVVEPLRTVGIDLDLSEYSKTHKQGGKAGIRIPIAEAGLDSARERSEKYRGKGGVISASEVANALKGLKGLLVIDEADAIRTIEDKKKLAELIKLLSDTGSAFKVLIVGIAETGEQITGGHPSVQRCLKETKLERMTVGELGQIVTGGAAKVGLQFSPDAVEAIVKLSAGYPHFTHLLALKCAEEAVSDGRQVVDKEHLRSALRLAVEDAEGSLRRAYDSAVRSYGTDMYKKILVAAATISDPEFTAEQLSTAIHRTTGEPITQYGLNNYLQRLVSEGYDTILRRRAKGVYSFNDPRMPSFIKIATSMLD